MSRMELMEFSKSQLAANCKMDRRTIDKRLTGLKPHRKSGKVEFYFLAAVGPLIFNPSAELGGDHLDLTKEKAGLAKAQKIRIERENAVKEGVLADMEETVEVWQNHIGAARAKLLSLPAQLSNRCVGLDRGEIEDEARKLITAALEELSRDE